MEKASRRPVSARAALLFLTRMARANRYRLFRKNSEAISNLLIIMAQPDYIDRPAAASGEAMASGQSRRLLSSMHQNKKLHGRNFE